MSTHELRVNIKWLRDMQNGGTPEYPTFGVCTNLPYRSRLDNHFKTWPEFSGNLDYPVPAPSGRYPYIEYFESTYKWVGEYGDARRRLCGFIADRLEDSMQLKVGDNVVFKVLRTGVCGAGKVVQVLPWAKYPFKIEWVDAGGDKHIEQFNLDCFEEIQPA